MRTVFSNSPSPLAGATRLLLGAVLSLSPMLAAAFNSGSTGADGDFNPTVNTELQLPLDGIFNFKSVNIPQGVTVTFKRNAANTPVYVLVQNNATIDGTIDVSGQNSANTGAAGDGNLADDGSSGQSGPGGFDGGAGGYPGSPAVGLSRRGGDGQGPGGGLGNSGCGSIGGPNGASGGGFASKGGDAPYCTLAGGGNSYGNYWLQPLIGGSGGGGAGGTSNYIRGIGGGGGGGAILIAASGIINLAGKVL